MLRESHVLERLADLLLGRVRQDGLWRSRVRVVAGRQPDDRRRVAECLTPMREVVGPRRVAREPSADAFTDLVEAGLARVLHRFGEATVPHQGPVTGEDALLGSLVEVTGRSELRGADNPLLQPPGAVRDEVALPDDELRRERVQRRAA